MSGFGSKESKESFKQSEPSEFKNISAPMDVSGGISLKERQIEEWIDKQSDATQQGIRQHVVGHEELIFLTDVEF